MRFKPARALTIAVLATTLATSLAGCGAEAPTGVAAAPAAAPQASLLGGLLSTVTNLLTSTVTTLLSPVQVHTLRRTQPLTRTVVASQVIGPMGGAFVVPNTGLTVTVAPGAVKVPTTFSATAYAGYAIGYDFAPHQTFDAPVVLTQSFTGTNAAAVLRNGATLEGGYFKERSDVDWVAGEAMTSELLSTKVDATHGTVSMGVLHFSGYMVATGRSR